jgi:hypothetical protein
MRVADLPPLDDADDIFSSAQLTWHRIHAQNSGIGAFKRVENRFRRTHKGARRKILQQKFFARRSARFNCSRKAGGNFFAGAVGDERDAFTGLNREAGFDRVSRARDKFLLCCFSRHSIYCNFASASLP